MTEYPRHLPRFDYTGFNRYSLTFCTFERQELFVDGGHVELVLAHILRAAEEQGFVVLAYCFMPDHLHLLLEGAREDSNAKTFIARAKQYSGYYFKQATGASLWQRYGFERTLRDEEATHDCVHRHKPGARGSGCLARGLPVLGIEPVLARGNSRVPCGEGRLKPAATTAGFLGR